MATITEDRRPSLVELLAERGERRVQRLTDFDRAEIERALLAGFSINAIYRTTGVSKYIIRGVKNKMKERKEGA